MYRNNTCSFSTTGVIHVQYFKSSIWLHIFWLFVFSSLLVSISNCYKMPVSIRSQIYTLQFLTLYNRLFNKKQSFFCTNQLFMATTVFQGNLLSSECTDRRNRFSSHDIFTEIILIFYSAITLNNILIDNFKRKLCKLILIMIKLYIWNIILACICFFGLELRGRKQGFHNNPINKNIVLQ